MRTLLVPAQGRKVEPPQLTLRGLTETTTTSPPSVAMPSRSVSRSRSRAGRDPAGRLPNLLEIITYEEVGPPEGDMIRFAVAGVLLLFLGAVADALVWWPSKLLLLGVFGADCVRRMWRVAPRPLT